MPSLSSVPLQHVLFFAPYADIGLAGLYLLVTANDNMVAWLLGLQMISFLCLYLVGVMGNHYVKVYCILSNGMYLSIFILYLLHAIITSKSTASEALWFFRIPQLVALFWVPQISIITFVLAVPSISEIVPGQLYLGNAVAATTPGFLKEFKIDAVLELHDNRKKNDPSKVEAELLQLNCSDDLGSQESLMAMGPEAIDFMDKILVTNKEGKTPGRLFVHCAAGGSRSPALIVHWLVTSGKESSVEDAVRTVRKARPFVDISSDHLGAVQSFHDKAAIKKST